MRVNCYFLYKYTIIVINNNGFYSVLRVLDKNINLKKIILSVRARKFFINNNLSHDDKFETSRIKFSLKLKPFYFKSTSDLNY